MAEYFAGNRYSSIALMKFPVVNQPYEKPYNRCGIKPSIVIIAKKRNFKKKKKQYPDKAYCGDIDGE